MNTNLPNTDMIAQAIRGILTAIAAFVCLVGLFAPNEIKNPSTSTTATQQARTTQTFDATYNQNFNAAMAEVFNTNGYVVGDNIYADTALEDVKAKVTSDTDPSITDGSNIAYYFWYRPDAQYLTPQQLANEFYTYLTTTKSYLNPNSVTIGSWGVAVTQWPNTPNVEAMIYFSTTA